MSAFDYDLFVIGAGSGGVRAARFAAGQGAKVAVAEERHLGGTCVNIGCVPKKLMVYASHYASDFKDSAGFGWRVGQRDFDWKTLIDNKTAEIERLNGIYGDLLDGSGVTLFEARAKITGPHSLSVAGQEITARYILVAVGNRPIRGSEPGQELGIVSDDVFYLDKQPERLIVVGGGYIAVEFAGIFNGLGSQTIQLYRGDLFLRGFDHDLRGFLAEEMVKKGVDLRFKTLVKKIEKSAGGLAATLSDGTVEEVDQVLYAIGRTPNTDGLGLETAGVETNGLGAIKVDDYYCTSAPSIYALGDVTDRMQLTPVALAEAMAVVKTLFGGTPSKLDYDNIPTAVFSQPPLATVGLSEEEARKRHGQVDVYRAHFRPMKHTLSGSDEKMMMKLIVDRASQKVLGAHMGGDDAGEIIQGVAIAIKAGATKADFDATLGIHPTAAEEFVTMRAPLADPKEQVAAD
jgi:glutathione reductase (NADPH)|tara:strand:- start:8073 stop:9452 length:1380 start_codon:yes stop_codon:yes gene_type:complete